MSEPREVTVLGSTGSIGRQSIAVAGQNPGRLRVTGLAAGGMTMLIATHEMSFAREIADRVCFLDEGVILEEGPPEAIFKHPSQPRTQQFLERIVEAGRL